MFDEPTTPISQKPLPIRTENARRYRKMSAPTPKLPKKTSPLAIVLLKHLTSQLTYLQRVVHILSKNFKKRNLIQKTFLVTYFKYYQFYQQMHPTPDVVILNMFINQFRVRKVFEYDYVIQEGDFIDGMDVVIYGKALCFQSNGKKEEYALLDFNMFENKLKEKPFFAEVDTWIKKEKQQSEDLKLDSMIKIMKKNWDKKQLKPEDIQILYILFIYKHCRLLGIFMKGDHINFSSMTQKSLNVKSDQSILALTEMQIAYVNQKNLPDVVSQYFKNLTKTTLFHLQNQLIFKNVSERILDKLSSFCIQKQFRKNWAIQLHKTDYKFAYLLVEGEVQMKKNKRTTALIQPGELFNLFFLDSDFEEKAQQNWDQYDYYGQTQGTIIQIDFLKAFKGNLNPLDSQILISAIRNKNNFDKENKQQLPNYRYSGLDYQDLQLKIQQDIKQKEKLLKKKIDIDKQKRKKENLYYEMKSIIDQKSGYFKNKFEFQTNLNNYSKLKNDYFNNSKDQYAQIKYFQQEIQSIRTFQVLTPAYVIQKNRLNLFQLKKMEKEKQKEKEKYYLNLPLKQDNQLLQKKSQYNAKKFKSVDKQNSTLCYIMDNSTDAQIQEKSFFKITTLDDIKPFKLKLND